MPKQLKKKTLFLKFLKKKTATEICRRIVGNKSVEKSMCILITIGIGILKQISKNCSKELIKSIPKNEIAKENYLSFPKKIKDVWNSEWYVMVTTIDRRQKTCSTKLIINRAIKYSQNRKLWSKINSLTIPKINFTYLFFFIWNFFGDCLENSFNVFLEYPNGNFRCYSFGNSI